MPDGKTDAAFLRELFDKAPLPYQSLDDQGRFLKVNAAFCELLGYTEQELLGLPFREILAPESRQVIAERFADFKVAGRVDRAEFVIVAKDGSPVPVELSGTIATDADGRFLRTHCIFMDVSERRWAERRLRASEQRYRNLVEMAHEGIWHIDNEARTVFVNASMAAMLEYTPEEMVGRHLFEFMDEGGRRIAQDNLRRREQGIAEEHDFEFTTRSGRRVYAAVATRPIMDEQNEYQGAVAGVIDMSARRILDQRLLRAQKLEGLEVMAGGIAHDFNNLLQTILGNAELGLVSGPYAADVGLAFGAIEKAAHQAAELCRQMLAYAGRGVYTMQAVRMDDLVMDIEALLRATITRKADLRFDLAADLPSVTGDAAHLRQALVNLVTNAAEALGGRQGRVDVVTSVRRLEPDEASRMFSDEQAPGGEFVVVAVQDNGCGMTPEVQNSIFDPFYSTKFAGRGLGLAVVRGVALAHGGGVTVHSEPGRGSRFELWLPVARAAAAALPCGVPDAAVVPAEAERTVLVAEDDDELRDLLQRMIERLGWNAVGVPDGAAAVAAQSENPRRFSAVILDWSMPVMDGREALEAIRLSAPDLPVFMSTGHAVDALVAEVDHLRPTGFLAKPYRLAELRRVLAALDPAPAD